MRLFVLLLSLVAPLSHAADQLLTLKTGEKLKVTVASLQRVALENPDIVEVGVNGNSVVVLEGRHPGTTTLRVWNKEGRKTFQVRVDP